MDVAAGLDYVRSNSRAIIATARPDGTPQMSPVTVAVVDDSVVMSTRETAFKVRQLRRDPTAYLCVFPDKWLGRWVQLNCRSVGQRSARRQVRDGDTRSRESHPELGQAP